MTFSEKLITLRAGRGWSQEKLAEALGVTRQAVSRWERGTSLPDALGLTGLARVFDVDAEWLVDDADAGAPKPRTARRVKLAWFDWVMIVLAASCVIAMLFGVNMAAAERVFKSTYYYPAWTWLPLFMHYFVWAAIGWSAVALIYSFLVSPLPLKRPVKWAFIIVGVAVIAVCLVSIFVTWGQFLRLVDLDISVRTYLRIIERPEVCVVPGMLFSSCAKRKVK